MNSTVTATAGLPPPSPSSRPHLDKKPGAATALMFLALLVVGLAYTAMSLVNDVGETGVRTTTYLPYVLLGIALLIALGFEFVNGFHDTANAVATVIYTHSLPPNFAVVWSGTFNFLGVLLSSGAVAFGIISLLPVELILQVGSGAGFAMVFALLLAAIVWNLGTWYLGLPASSSHTLIGSIIGVGVANALMHGRDGTSGVDWAQATKVGYSLLLSPLIGLMPHAVLASIVIVYSVGLIKLADFRAILAIRRTEFVWAVAALLGVIVLGTLKGIVVAIIVSIVALAQQVANPPVYVLGRKPGTNVFRPRSREHPDDETFPGLLLLRAEGRIFFLNAERLA